MQTVHRQGPLTSSAENTLTAIAWMVGEPGGEFRVTDLVTFENTCCAGRRPCAGTYVSHEFRIPPVGSVHTCERCGMRERRSSGMRGKTLPALMDRGYVKQISWGRYQLTDLGYMTAEGLTGERIDVVGYPDDPQEEIVLMIMRCTDEALVMAIMVAKKLTPDLLPLLYQEVYWRARFN